MNFVAMDGVNVSLNTAKSGYFQGPSAKDLLLAQSALAPLLADTLPACTQQLVESSFWHGCLDDPLLLLEPGHFLKSMPDPSSAQWKVDCEPGSVS